MLTKTTTLLTLCCGMSLLHYASSLDLTGVAVTTMNTSLYPPLDYVTSVPTAVYICRGGMQMHAGKPLELMVTVCTNSRLKLAAAIGTLPIDQLDQPVNILYGNANSSHTTRFDPANYVDGDNSTMRIAEPEYLYQTSDGKKIFFTDDRSCLREIDRVTGNLTTLIGTCGISTLDWVRGGGIYIHYQARAINGMVYYEAAKTWIISVENNGLFAYIRSKRSGNFEGRLLIKKDELSTSVTDFSKQLYINGDIVWKKVNYGLNRYNVSHFTEDGNGNLSYSNGTSSTFRRQLSAVFGVAPDSTAIHQTRDQMRQLGQQNAEFSIIPAYPDIVMLADDDLQRLYFYNSDTGNVFTICSKGAPADGNATECRFLTLRAAVWVDEFKIIVFETVGSLMRVVTWPDADAGSFYNSDTGNVEFCPIGQFQPNTNQLTCEFCPPGTTTKDEGSDSKDDCVGRWKIILAGIAGAGAGVGVVGGGGVLVGKKLLRNKESDTEQGMAEDPLNGGKAEDL